MNSILWKECNMTKYDFSRDIKENEMEILCSNRKSINTKKAFYKALLYSAIIHTISRSDKKCPIYWGLLIAVFVLCLVDLNNPNIFYYRDHWPICVDIINERGRGKCVLHDCYVGRVILARQLLLPTNEWSRGRHKKLFSAPPHAQRSGGGLREGINSSGGVANTVCYDDGGTGRWLAHFHSPETQTAELSTGHPWLLRHNKVCFDSAYKVCPRSQTIS